MPVDLSVMSQISTLRSGSQCFLASHTCGLIKTRSMKSTTKSCSTYLSQNRPQFLQTVSRILWPLDLSPAPEYCVHSVLTGCRHSIQMGIWKYLRCSFLQQCVIVRYRSGSLSNIARFMLPRYGGIAAKWKPVAACRRDSLRRTRSALKVPL